MPDDLSLDNVPDDIKNAILASTGATELSDADRQRYFTKGDDSADTAPPELVAALDSIPDMTQTDDGGTQNA